MAGADVVFSGLRCGVLLQFHKSGDASWCQCRLAGCSAYGQQAFGRDVGCTVHLPQAAVAVYINDNGEYVFGIVCCHDRKFAVFVAEG